MNRGDLFGFARDPRVRDGHEDVLTLDQSQPSQTSRSGIRYGTVGTLEAKPAFPDGLVIATYGYR